MSVGVKGLYFLVVDFMGLVLSDGTAFLLPPANVVCEGYVFTGVCHSFCSQGGGRACHMTNEDYIRSCTVGGSQLVRRQHTGNIKCMMG